jgi:hypothetical protein
VESNREIKKCREKKERTGEGSMVGGREERDGRKRKALMGGDQKGMCRKVLICLVPNFPFFY